MQIYVDLGKKASPPPASHSQVKNSIVPCTSTTGTPGHDHLIKITKHQESNGITWQSSKVKNLLVTKDTAIFSRIVNDLGHIRLGFCPPPHLPMVMITVRIWNTDLLYILLYEANGVQAQELCYTGNYPHCLA